MIKKNLHHIIISSILIVLPILFGVIFWNKLPYMMITHWDVNGVPDGSMSRPFCVFGMPLIMLALHWLAVLVTSFDKKNKGQSQKILRVIFYIVPAVSIFASSVIYATAFGYKIEISKITLVLFGIMFVILGNFLPKCKQNSAIGVRFPWTLSNEKIWNKTHRLCGKLWVASGIVMLVCVFLPSKWIIFVIMAAVLSAVIVPTVYSYSLYKKSN